MSVLQAMVCAINNSRGVVGSGRGGGGEHMFSSQGRAWLQVVDIRDVYIIDIDCPLGVCNCCLMAWSIDVSLFSHLQVVLSVHPTYVHMPLESLTLDVYTVDVPKGSKGDIGGHSCYYYWLSAQVYTYYLFSGTIFVIRETVSVNREASPLFMNHLCYSITSFIIQEPSLICHP